jgi:thiopurine S-methyltransferase
VDLCWLRAQGHPVVAVELSEDAARAFYAEAGLAPMRVEDGAFIRYHADAIDYRVGDFLALDAVTLGEFGAVWDRGALVALPPPMRARYAAHLIQLSAATTRTLLITLEYAQSQMKGPPFAVPETEVHALFAASHEIALLLREDILDLEPRFRDRGVSALHSVVYALTRRESPQS